MSLSALTATLMYAVFIIWLRFAAGYHSDPEGEALVLVGIGLPWDLVVRGSSFRYDVALVLNAITVYAITALGIAFCGKSRHR